MEILESRSTITKVRNSLKGLNSIFELGGRKNMSELEDRLVEIMKFEKQKNEEK